MSIYKDCDIRGIYETELTHGDAYRIGRAVGTLMTGKRLAVGGDVRISTPALKRRLVEGLAASGAHVLDLSMVPTPVFYYAIKRLEADGGVMVTASHNPARYNGFKLMLGDMPVTPADIAAIARLADEGRFAWGAGTVEAADVTDAYRLEMLALAGPSGLRIVVDAGNGAVSELAPRLAREAGCDVVPLFCDFNGSFPNREPNPAVSENLERLRKMVVESGAHLGAGFDGDGDRVAFVDEKGRIVTGEQSLCVFIRDAFGREKDASVVYDQKSASIVRKEAEKAGGRAIMERSGHAFIKAAFLRNHSALAGEISGHFFFRELGHDDGIYAMLKMCRLAADDGRPLSRIVADFPTPLITPDIRLAWPYGEQEALLDAVSALERRYPVARMDGVRVEFPAGGCWSASRSPRRE